MRGICDVSNCSIPDESRKIHEDFEVLDRNVCWECGERIKKTVENHMANFLNVIQAIEKELK
jgi:transcriptional regulator NrdR family protein